MPSLNRRGFLGTSFGSLAAAWSIGPGLLTGNTAFAEDQQAGGVQEFSPDTLFLTWQRDPTTTMTIQWIAAETASDKSIHYKPLEGEIVPGRERRSRNRIRTRISRSTPPLRAHGADPRRSRNTRFRSAAGATAYRFRTMPAKATNTFQWVSGGDAGIDEHAIGTNILAARQEPYFALIAGDLAYDNGRSSLATFVKFLEELQSPHGRIRISVRLISAGVAPGIHEVDGGYQRPTPGRIRRSFFERFRWLSYSDTTYGVLDFRRLFEPGAALDTDHHRHRSPASRRGGWLIPRPRGRIDRT